MKKNLFQISTDEVQRILSLHESRTKSQYLNLTEQAANAAKGTMENPYTDDELQKEVDIIVDIIDGYSNDGDMKAILRKLQNYRYKVAVNDDNPTKPFNTTALSRIYALYKKDENIELVKDVSNEWAMGSSKYRDQLINFINSTKNEKIQQPKKVEKTQFDIKLDHSFGNGAFKVPAKSVAKKYNAENVLITTPDKKQVWFNCKTSTYSNGGAYVPEDKNQTGLATNLLSASYLCNKPKASGPPPIDGTTPPPVNSKTPLTDDQKLERAKLCGYSTWDEYKNNNWACATQLDTVTVSAKKQKNQQFRNNTINYTKQIQQALGNQNATGQLSSTDIDSILAKLGGNAPQQ